MRQRIAIVYNAPELSRYAAVGEDKAIVGVIEGVEAVEEALATLGYESLILPLSPPMDKAQKKLRMLQADVIFNLFEGFDGRPETEAEMASVIAGMGIPYTGCPPSALEIALDKARVKDIFLHSSIKTARYQILKPNDLAMFGLNFPCIVKPIGEDASHGLTDKSVVYNNNELARQVKMVSGYYGGRSLVEEFLEGREFNVIIMGNDSQVALPVSEIVYTLPPDLPKILTYESKWEPESVYYHNTEAHCPANIDDPLRQQIIRTAVTAYRLVGCVGYARVDMRLDREGMVNVLEVNPNPDISPTSGAARQIKAAGLTYAEFIERVIELAKQYFR